MPLRSTVLRNALLLSVLLTGGAQAQWVPGSPVTSYKQQPDGVLLTLGTGVLRVQVCTDSILRITQSPTATIPDLPEYVVTKTSWPPAKFTVQEEQRGIVISTSRVRVVVSRRDSSLTYSEVGGKHLVGFDPNTFTPVTVNGEKMYQSEADIGMWNSTEAFYGLGQHQAGVWNYHGESVPMAQDNTNIAIPLLLSSNGYGIFWNNAARGAFDNKFLHGMYITFEAADTVDYYFLYGPDFDKMVASYRELTGTAPLFGKWAYGFWQCKNKYNSQAELLEIAGKYRQLHIPADNIVQDWYWWGIMGDFKFNKNYPDPPALLKGLHDDHFHLMISVWPYFGPGSDVYADMDKKGFFIAKMQSPGFHPVGSGLYDATNPEARKYYWNLMNNALFKIGVDAWWLDTTEPETSGREVNLMSLNKVAIGNGARYNNLYPLMTTKGVYEGQRAASDQKRVFILTRSSYAGMQRNSAATWSGDVNSDWEDLRRQVPAGLNYSLSGMPYWTTDIGGFTSGSPDDPAYRELFIRWFQYGAFCPVFRVHGTRTPSHNELWSYGPEAQKILTAFDTLRYELMPYIYSVAWKTTSEHYTPMRPLVMDYRTDVRAQNTGDEFLFGPSILVSPVTEQGATSRHLYLPKAQWVDFWSGKTVEGGKAIDAAAPLERIPLFVRAGSIVPMGPDVEYAAEKPADPIELRVYRGADAAFTLYEDENDTYNYEKGAYAVIPVEWSEKAATLTIGARKGSFPGMLANRTFRIVFVGENHGAGIGSTAKPDKVVPYSGQPVTVKP